MELLRRALLVGCCLAGLWLLRLAPLDPLVSIGRIDFAQRQQDEARSVPDGRKSDAQRRRAELPLSVYIEEHLQYNVFSAAGPEWDRFLARIDTTLASAGASGRVVMRLDEAPIRDVIPKLASGGGITYVSMSRPGGDVHYEVIEHRWSREAFQPGRGFAGQPAPPASLLYPFRTVGLAVILGGLLLFLLLPGRSASLRVTPGELAALGAGLCLFALPLVMLGGSAQGLTRGLLLTLPCWMLTAICVHVFAGPWRTAPHPVEAPDDSSVSHGPTRRGPITALFVREGLVFLLIAIGPVAFLICGTMILWNR
jgi:hypothetical protein